MHYKTIYEAQLMALYHGIEYSVNQQLLEIKVLASSYHIFEPQEGDKNIDGYVFDAKRQAWKKTIETACGELVTTVRLPPPKVAISQRNGKAFIMPERE